MSILLIYDFENPSNNKVKLIDFGRASQSGNLTYDKEACQGIENIIKFLCDILNNLHEYK